MKIESLPNAFREIVHNNSGLRLYLNNLTKGRGATPRSWLYEGRTDTDVLHDWLAVLERDLPKLGERGDLVYQYETSFLEKFGPQGKVAPIEELMDIVTEGFSLAGTPQPEIFRSRLWQQAKLLARQHLFDSGRLEHRLRPRAYAQVLDDMRARDTLESNSGFPLFQRRKKPESIQQALAAISDGSYLSYPAIVLFRNYNGKTRPVWMYPESTNIVEGSFTQPLKELILGTGVKFFAPWRGYAYVKHHITSSYEDGFVTAASDFSHTDAHFTKYAMLEVYDVIKHAFQPQYWDALKVSMLHVCDIGLIVGSDSWITGDHGVSSGSNWTNDVETYFDYIAEWYLVLSGLVAEPDTAIGDDVSHRMKQFNPDFSNKIAEIYQSMGFDVNAEKVTNAPNFVKYLQRLVIKGWYSDYVDLIDNKETKNLRGIYRTVKALNSELNPEKFHKPKLWSVDMYASRAFMIAENTVDHPLFHEFIRFLCKGDPRLVEFAKKSNKELNEIQVKSRLLPGLNPTYNQEKRDRRFSEFESIKFARTL